MSFVIVPNYISDAIYLKIDEQLEKMPELKPQRENIFKDLLDHFDKTGQIPEFELQPVLTTNDPLIKDTK